MLFINKRYCSVVILLLLLCSCKKYLDEKPLKSLAVPSRLEDLQALLDNMIIMNSRFAELSELVADNYYATTTAYQSAPVDDRTNYIWDKEAYSLFTWRAYYQFPVYYSNVVLDRLPFITQTAGSEAFFNEVKGAALFFRSFSFWHLAQLYCSPYDAATAGDLGIPLRINSDIEDVATRATVQQTYDCIISDLKTAISLLPETTLFPTRPNKAAAYAALARTYLSMREYENAGLYADSSLRLYHELIDYNTLIPVTAPPIRRFHKETLFYGIAPSTFKVLYPSTGRIDSLLYRSYDNNDLRKTVFFYSNTDGSFSFRGSYDGDYSESSSFTGIAVDEILLIRAECYARNGAAEAAMRDLNTLMEKRWRKSAGFIPLTAVNAQEALIIILRERRKELLYRGLRWSDLRRFNLEGAAITLKRVIAGVTYELPPGDPRWVLLIPREVIALSGMPQNKR